MGLQRLRSPPAEPISAVRRASDLVSTTLELVRVALLSKSGYTAFETGLYSRVRGTRVPVEACVEGLGRRYVQPILRFQLCCTLKATSPQAALQLAHSLVAESNTISRNYDGSARPSRPVESRSLTRFRAIASTRPHRLQPYGTEDQSRQRL